MVEITAQMVKELREATGAGPKDCKTALEQHGGDMQKAIDYLREKGLAKAAKKLGAGRAMHEGLIESYIHFNKRMGALVEVNCETDFVAATEAFKTFTRDLALHIATAGPQYVTRDQVPAEMVEAERDLQKRRAIEEGKPEAVAEKVAEGRMNKFFEDIVLMDQFFIKDDSKTISQLLQELVVEVGESVQINRFSRFVLGESAAAEGDEA